MSKMSSALLLVLVLSMAIVVYLQSRDVTSSFRAVKLVADDLREPGVQGRSVDPELAQRVTTSLEQLLEQPEAISENLDELREIGAVAASWAAAAPSPSWELQFAVAVRGTANELREYASRPSDRQLESARRELQRARAALAGDTAPGSSVDAIRDRLLNLQRSQEERAQEINENLGH